MAGLKVLELPAQPAALVVLTLVVCPPLPVVKEKGAPQRLSHMPSVGLFRVPRRHRHESMTAIVAGSCARSGSCSPQRSGAAGDPDCRSFAANTRRVDLLAGSGATCNRTRRPSRAPARSRRGAVPGPQVVR
jgi:hypothetical protein